MLDFVTLSVFLPTVAGLVLYVSLKYLRIKLREPQKGFFEVVALAYKTKAVLPAPFKTPQMRRQLVLASSRPAELTNLMDMRVDTLDLKKKRPLVYGFLHPRADGGGGGERVLWAAVKELLSTDENAVAVIYTGAKDGLTQSKLLTQAAERFGIGFAASEVDRVVVIALTQAWLADPSTFAAFTLVAQAIGMAVVGYEAISNLMPDVLVDTTGLAFAYPLVSWLAKIPIVAYVHYPFVQTEMLAAVKAQGLLHPKRMAKYVYWRTLTAAYRWAGSFADVVAVNSTWTKQHLGWKQSKDAAIVYPPSAVEEFTDPAVAAAAAKSAKGMPRIAAVVYLAQFRPEKRHEMVIGSFAKALRLARKDHTIPSANRKPHLILIGSVRDEFDQVRVKALRVLAEDLGLTDEDYTIVENAPWEAVKKIMSSALIGVNAMWNEHFGMAVVESMAAGLIPVVHASAGPYMDIVKDEQGAPGVFFRSAQDPDGQGLKGFPTLSAALLQVLALPEAEQARLRERAWRASQRFSDGAFAQNWGPQMALATAKTVEYARKRRNLKLFD